MVVVHIVHREKSEIIDLVCIVLEVMSDNMDLVHIDPTVMSETVGVIHVRQSVNTTHFFALLPSQGPLCCRDRRRMALPPSLAPEPSSSPSASATERPGG